MKYIIPTKMFTYDFYERRFKPIIIDQVYSINEEFKELTFRGKPSGYLVSNIGRVKKPNGEDSPLYYDKDGYTRFCLYIPKNHPIYKNSKRIAYPYKTHRAVAELFVVNPDPTEYDIIMHKNDIPDCNFYVNLMWGNSQMNMDDKHFSHRERYLRGEEKSDALFNEKDVREICECIYVHNIRKTKDVIKFLNKENIDPLLMISYKNLIANIRKKHCWKYIIKEYTDL